MRGRSGSYFGTTYDDDEDDEEGVINRGGNRGDIWNIPLTLPPPLSSRASYEPLDHTDVHDVISHQHEVDLNHNIDMQDVSDILEFPLSPLKSISISTSTSTTPVGAASATTNANVNTRMSSVTEEGE